MAKFGVAVDNWMDETQLDATAIQCWTAMEEFFGVVPCTLMSMMSNDLMPSACEVDVMGAVAMDALANASGMPSALVDWNNNYGDDPDKGVIFHCSNLPKDIFEQEGENKPAMEYQEIIAGTVGAENTYGTIYGRVKRQPVHLPARQHRRRIGQDPAYVGEGELTDDPLLTFGGYGVVKVPQSAGAAPLHLRERLRAPRLASTRPRPAGPSTRRWASTWAGMFTGIAKRGAADGSGAESRNNRGFSGLHGFCTGGRSV